MTAVGSFDMNPARLVLFTVRLLPRAFVPSFLLVTSLVLSL